MPPPGNAERRSGGPAQTAADVKGTQQDIFARSAATDKSDLAALQLTIGRQLLLFGFAAGTLSAAVATAIACGCWP